MTDGKSFHGLAELVAARFIDDRVSVVPVKTAGASTAVRATTLSLDPRCTI